jgi:hypothetical protein
VHRNWYRISFTFYILSNICKSTHLDLIITEGTWVVEMRIWCIKIGNVLVLHFNPWVETSVGGFLVPDGLYSPVAKYFGICFETRICKQHEYELNCQDRSKLYKFISKRMIISLRHSSILRRIWLNFMTLCLVLIRRLSQFHFLSDFPLFRPEHHWRDLSSRNAHLVRQHW